MAPPICPAPMNAVVSGLPSWVRDISLFGLRESERYFHSFRNMQVFQRTRCAETCVGFGMLTLRFPCFKACVRSSPSSSRARDGSEEDLVDAQKVLETHRGAMGRPVEPLEQSEALDELARPACGEGRVGLH